MPNRYWADVSGWTGAINAHEYASAGHLLIGVKATEGTTYVSPRHAEQCEAAHSAGVVVVHYHYNRPDVIPTGAGEAGHFWTVVKDHYRAGDYLAFDLEVQHANGWRALPGYLHHCDDTLHKITGHQAIGYTYSSFIGQAGPALQVMSRRWWIAAYGPRPQRLGARRSLWAWQYTDGQAGPTPHAYAGIGHCDGNLLNIWTAAKLARVRSRRRHRGR